MGTCLTDHAARVDLLVFKLVYVMKIDRGRLRAFRNTRTNIDLEQGDHILLPPSAILVAWDRLLSIFGVRRRPRPMRIGKVISIQRLHARSLKDSDQVKMPSGSIATVSSIHWRNGMDGKDPILMGNCDELKTAYAIEVNFYDHDPVIAHPHVTVPLVKPLDVPKEKPRARFYKWFGR